MATFNKNSLFTFVGLTLCTGLMTTACQTENTTQALKLGSLFPMTGDAEALGEDLSQAVTLAVDTINACGGVNEQPVTLIQEDSQTNPNAAAAAMSKLVTVEKVAGVVGASASSVSSLTVDIAVDNQVMQISGGSSSTAFTERAQAGEFKGYWARTFPSATYQAQVLAKLAIEQGFQRISTIAIDNSYGIALEQEFVKSFKQLGGTVINEDNPVRYDPNPNSLDAQVAQAYANNPDAVLGILYGETGTFLLRSAHEQGYSEGVTPLLTDGVYSQEFVNNLGKTENGKSIIEGALGTVPGASGEGLDSFTQTWQQEIGAEMTIPVPYTWDATVLMMLAAELANENTGTAIKDNLRSISNSPGTEVSDPCEAMALIRQGEEINYQGASGDLELDEYGDTISSYDVWTVDSLGELEVIDQVTPTVGN
jgi:neutral amino acid transport system substrate-binding protein